MTTEAISLVELAIWPKSKADREKLGQALDHLVREDPTFLVSTDWETGLIVLKGTGESHLAMKTDILRRLYTIDIDIGDPQVAYRETLGRRSEIDYIYKKQNGGSGQFARVKIAFEPGAPGSGYLFENKVGAVSLSCAFISAIEKGLAAARETGVLAGFPVIDFKAVLIGGNYHDADLNVLAFEIAARAAFREGLAKAQCRLLEPIMTVEVAAPAEYGDGIVDDLGRRRAQAVGLELSDGFHLITATVPLAKMLGYNRALRLITQRATTWTMTFDRYAPVPSLSDDEPPFQPAATMRA